MARAGGRHALDEDAVQTPIFAALRRGGRRQQENVVGSGAPVASVEDFRRDPLTAPIPIRRRAGGHRHAGRRASATTAGEGSSAGLGRWHGRLPRGAVNGRHGVATRSGPHRASGQAASRDWAGLDALADTGRHHLRPVRR